MDKLQWFKFSPYDWKMGKIQRVPEVTQMRFIMLICLYWNKECVLSIEDAELEIDKEHLDLLILKKVVKIFNGRVIIDFLNEQMEDIGQTSIGRTKAANARWDKYREGLQNDANALQNDASAMQSHAEESREDKINLTVNWDRLLEQFNSITGKKAIAVNDKVKRSIRARLKEGYSKENIIDAIYNCANDSYHKETNLKYLTLEFISRPDKMEKYATIKPIKQTA